jgi:hypothetical protein
MIQNPAILLGLALAMSGCGSSSEPGKDWSKKPLDATIESKVNGAGFKLSVPKGWKFDATVGAESDPAAISKQWRPDVDDYFSEPSVTVSYASIPAKDLEGFVGDAMLDDKYTVVKKAAIADGFVLTAHTKNHGIVRAHVMKRKGEVHIDCRASQAKTGGVPSPAATMAWLEQLCSSLTIL